MTNLALALGFMTRLPIGNRTSLDRGALSRAAVWFPIIGVLVGGLMAGARAVVGLVLGHAPATVCALAIGAIVTGGLHEDGLADCADALGAHVDRDRRLEILHDPRLGTYGTLALVYSTLLAFTLLSGLDDRRFLEAVVIAGALGRWSTLPLSLALPPAAQSGSGTLVRVSVRVTLVGTAIAVVTSLAIAGWSAGALAASAAALAAILGGAVAVAALGGVTGDVFGAVSKFAELAAYVALVAAWS
jgi:adenosylcobinamide-GDP ribazoletransferase